VRTPLLLALRSHSALGAADYGADGAYAPWAVLPDPALQRSSLALVDRDLQLGHPSTWAARLATFIGPQWQATFAFRAGIPPRAAPLSPRRRLQGIVIG
jgi:hypothetical protein